MSDVCHVEGCGAPFHGTCLCRGIYEINLAELQAKNDALREKLRVAVEALDMIACHPIRHDPQAYAVVRGMADSALATIGKEKERE